MTGPTADAPFAAALCLLPGMGTATLVRVLSQARPRDVWEGVRAGAISRPVGHRPRDVETLWSDQTTEAGGHEWRDMARRIDPQAWWERRADPAIGVTWFGGPGYPGALRDDPEPPGVLFWRGSLEWLRRPCVALIGTRRATADGRAVAYELGRDLAAAGVCVVSGLALGIDGAAHAGALRAREEGGTGPVAVVASGVDVPYPRRHAELWDRVASSGAVISETLPGSAAEAWRFPVRNRLIAGLSRMVVVVESHAAGGSLVTAEAAIARGVEVRAVPGPVRSPASAGSNQLLYDGPGPVRSAQDVLDGLGDFRPAAVVPPRPVATRPEVDVTDLDAVQRAVLDATGWRPVSLTRIVERAGLPVPAVMAALDEIERRGLVRRDGTWWVRRP